MGKKEYKADVIFTYPSRLIAEIYINGDSRVFRNIHIKVDVMGFLPGPYNFDFDNANDLRSFPVFARQLENGEVIDALSALEKTAQPIISDVIRKGIYPCKRSIRFGDIIFSDEARRIEPKMPDARIPNKSRKSRHKHD